MWMKRIKIYIRKKANQKRRRQSKAENIRHERQRRIELKETAYSDEIAPRTTKSITQSTKDKCYSNEFRGRKNSRCHQFKNSDTIIANRRFREK